MSRRIHIIGNWKMNHDLHSAESFWDQLEGEEYNDQIVAGVAVPSPLLAQALEKCPGQMKIYAQNIHHVDSGAYTGETSATMIKSIQVNGTLIGHSERRQYFFESDDQVRSKIARALEQDLEIILCVGEPLEIRSRGEHLRYVASQVREALKEVREGDLPHIVLAYEPIWAIGTGETATASQAEEMCRSIRECVAELYTATAAQNIIILYGGSVKPANCKELLDMPNVDGGLVGGASLSPETYLDLLRYNQ